MTFRSRNQGVGIAPGTSLAALVAAALVLLAPTAAHADGIDWTTGPTTHPVRRLLVSRSNAVGPECPVLFSTFVGCEVQVSYTGTASGSFTAGVDHSMVRFDSSLGGTVTEPLAPGGYQFTMVFNSLTPPATTTTPFVLTVNPAAISTDVRITPDPATPRGAVVSLALNGPYVDNAYYGGYPIPEGTWSVTVTDADGKDAFAASLPQAAGTVASANFYWSDVPPVPDLRRDGDVHSESAATLGNVAVTLRFRRPSPRPRPLSKRPPPPTRATRRPPPDRSRSPRCRCGC